MAKDLKGLNTSRQRYQDLKQLFGSSLPSSVMLFDRQDKAIDLMAVGANGKYSNTQRQATNKAKMIKKGMHPTLASAFKGSYCGSRTGTLSIFPQNIGRTLLNFYTVPGDKVIDPFAGHNSRMQLCVEAKRHYYGQDLCHEFMELNYEVRNVLLQGLPFAKSNDIIIELREGDSRHLQFEDNFADFSITSPPYWNVEYYGPEEEQLYNCKTYKGFLDDLQLVMVETYRCLKPGAYCTWFINDFRMGGTFYNYHGDVINRMKEVGFAQKDIVIVNLGRSLVSCYLPQCFEKKYIPKQHEYAPIFQKPK